MSLARQFKSMPRAAKWLIAFGVFIGAYFLVIEPVVEATSSYNAKADELDKELTRRRDTTERMTNTGADLERAMLAFGRPAIPGKLSNPYEALDRRLDQVIGAHSGVRAIRRSPGRPTPVTSGPANQPTKYTRQVIDLTIECDTQGLIEVLKDLERAPEVTAIGRVTVRKIDAGRSRDSGLLSVQLAPEVWWLTGNERVSQ